MIFCALFGLILCFAGLVCNHIYQKKAAEMPQEQSDEFYIYMIGLSMAAVTITIFVLIVIIFGII